MLTVDTPATPNREHNLRAGFTSPLRPSLRLAWDGLTRPRWLFGTFLRTLVRHGMPHFENSYAERGVAMLSRGVDARIRRARPSRLDAPRAHPRALARQARDQGHPASRRRAPRARYRRRRHHRVQPRRPPARRHGLAASGAARGRRRVPATCPVMFDGGIRRGTDVAEGAGAWRAVRARRPAVQLRRGDRRRRRRSHAIALLASEIDRDMAMLGVRSIAEMSPRHLRRLA